MQKLSVKIRIADRDYPMKIDAREEEHLRKIGQMINMKVKSYQARFGIDDKQDLLAMVAFDCLVDKMANEENLEMIDQAVAEKIAHINRLIMQAM